MKTMEKTLIIGITVLGVGVCCLPVMLAADGGAWNKILADQYRAEEGEISFFGKVVDQDGAPVIGASVCVSMPIQETEGKLQTQRRKTFFTDNTGRFEISNRTCGGTHLKGHFLFVEGITGDGYDGAAIDDARSSFSFSLTNSRRFQPDAANPITYRMRKKGEVAVLLEESVLKLQLSVSQSGRSVGYDFVQSGRIRNVANPVGDDTTHVCDLQVKATFNTNDATWVVVLSPGNTNGGIIVSEQLLYEAPRDDYRREYTFTPEDRKPVKARCVYLKNRDPAIYTRLEIEYINANKEFFRLSGKSVTNPYGDRNLEQATDLPYEVTKQLTDDVKTAFRQNKRPTKPDLSKLIKAATEKGEKEHVKSPR